MKKTIKLLSRKIEKSIIRKFANSQISKSAEKLSGKVADSQSRKAPVPLNTLTTFPQYLKIPIRFWTSNVGHEIRSSFDLELYEKVCEARGVSSGVGIIC